MSLRSRASSSARRLLRDECGQSTVELALTLPVVLIVLIGALQFALVYHARSVAQTAAAEGARHAASEGRSPTDGAQRALQVLDSGLGDAGDEFTVEAADTGETVVVTARGSYRLFVPWITGEEITIATRAEVRKEGFRSGP